jgi:hypothetical protein
VRPNPKVQNRRETTTCHKGQNSKVLSQRPLQHFHEPLRL